MTQPVKNEKSTQGKNITLSAEKSQYRMLNCLSIEKSAYKSGPWLESGNLDFRSIPTISRTDKSGSLFLNCLCKL